VHLHADDFYMARALAVAERGRGRTSPNPMVGAVVVDREGIVVGSGSHERAGGPHAEVLALRAAGVRARDATLYCTLEPCSHVGRTGPCAPHVAAAGIARVVLAVEDPNPLVHGRGIAILTGRGVQVTTGVMRKEASALNRPFFHVMLRRRPFVTMKVALSEDGRISARPGIRTDLTGPAANRFIHRERAEMDALAVGSGTILADDPLLTPRGAFRQRPLIRVVFDTRLRTPPRARLFSTLEAGPVIIMSTAAGAAAAPDRQSALAAAGAELVLGVPGDEVHRDDALVTEVNSPGQAGSSSRIENIATAAGGALRAGLERLALRGISAMTVEGGAALHRSLWDAGLVDRVQIFRTPHRLGERGVEWLPDVASGAGLCDVTRMPLGADTLIEGYVHRPD
jgi:diaminohydroxyphosphoribosylaminopyrimidine deaminase / 5-amino-6-(5-phosphoribosylamino)uracil reductase